jgi:hypothetical protein
MVVYQLEVLIFFSWNAAHLDVHGLGVLLPSVKISTMMWRVLGVITEGTHASKSKSSYLQPELR